MSAGLVDDWKNKNTSVTKNDTDSLSELMYYLNMQLRFLGKVDIGRLPIIRYLNDTRLIWYVLAKNGVVDSSVQNEVQMVFRIIDTTIDNVESKYAVR